MEKVLFFFVAVSLSISKLVAQGAVLLREDQGVSLSYTMQFFKNCKEGPKEYKIYRITAYVSNKSGKAIKMGESYVSTNNSRYLHCISEYNNFGSMRFLPSGNLNASPEWDTQGRPWPNNSTLSGTYYIAIPVEDGEPPTPAWVMGAFIFVEEKKAAPEPQWSQWTTDQCFGGISFRYKSKELYNLNYQLHMHFEVKNSYREKVYFILSLKDERGKERFGTKYSAAPGQTIQLVEKMDGNYIKSIAIERVTFKNDDGKYVKCDGEREKEDQSKIDNSELIRKIQSMISTTPFPQEEKRREYQNKLNSIINYKIDEEKRHAHLLSLESELEYVSKNAYVIKDEKDKGQQLKSTNNAIAGRIKDKIKSLPQNATSSDYQNELDNIMNSRLEDDIKNKQLLALEEKINKETNEKAQKEEQSKKENEELINRIQAGINTFPAEGRKSQLQYELNQIVNLQIDETTKNPYLVGLEKKVNAEAANVKANIEKFNQDKEKRTEQIGNIREENQKIKQQQAALSTSYAGFAASILSIRRKQGKGLNYEGPASKLTLKPGLMFVYIPVGYIEHEQGSSINYNTGSRTAFHTKTFRETGMLTPAFSMSAEWHPYYSNYASIGVTGGAWLGYWINADDGFTNSTSDYAGNSQTLAMGANIGLEITGGLKQVKLLGKFQVQSLLYNTSGVTATTLSSSEYETYYDTEQDWKTTSIALGIRVGDYERSDWFVDVAYTRYVPTNVLSLTTKYSMSDLVIAGSLPVPSGVYVQVAKQNGLFFKAEYTKDYIVVDEDKKTTSPSTKPYITFTFGSNVEWFKTLKRRR